MVWFSDVPIVLSQSHSAFTCSKNASDRAYSSDLVSNFQRNFCSNFVCICCYVRLPSLHDLYDHVEEAHIGSTCMRAWPPKVFSELSEPRAISDQDSDCSPDDSVLAIAYSTDEYDYDVSPYEDTFQLHYLTTCDAENISQCTPLRHPIPHYERPCPPRPPQNVASGPAALEHDRAAVLTIQEDEPEAESPKRESSFGPIRSRLRNRELRTEVPPSLRRTLPPKSSTVIRTNAISPAVVVRSVQKKKVSKKDLIYTCLTPGCIKTYRNANGLKYHKEKGTCVISEQLLANNLSVDEQTSVSLPSQSQEIPTQSSRPERPRVSIRPSIPPMDYLVPSTSSSSPSTPEDIHMPPKSSVLFRISDELHPEHDDAVSGCVGSVDAFHDILICKRPQTSLQSPSRRSSGSPLSSISRSPSPLSILESSGSPPPVSPVDLRGFDLPLEVGVESNVPTTVFAPAVALTLDKSSSCPKRGRLDDILDSPMNVWRTRKGESQLDDRRRELDGDELECLDSMDSSSEDDSDDL
ncbi:hypothetical protein J3R30DRAFT_230589 [Lentinula aciculospora]|uniref:C2H2-type domain-containing protein n=1 Tax=Lentinula aciculospora TaxID=153920 RepID=A0A9W9AAA9_9AGAR|nr:hypothetical protein J3R30DRAFT_230589 [Lentinula aciculospora]